MKTYYLKVAKTFQSGHPRRHQPTNFKTLIQSGSKIHTIREQGGWAKAMADLNNGTAWLAVQQWTGLPYRSKVLTLFELKGGGGELITQELAESFHLEELAMNDGLSLEDFMAWFKASTDQELRQMLVGKIIIHFTTYRYGNK